MSGTAAADDARGGAAADRRPAGLPHAQGRQGFAAGSGAFGATQINARGAGAPGSAAASPQVQPATRVQSFQGSAATSPKRHAASTGGPTGTPGPAQAQAFRWPASPEAQPAAGAQPVQGSAATSPKRHAASTGRSTGTPAPAQSPSWTQEERIEYVRSLDVVTLPGEEVILGFLGDSLSKAPLPSPWHMARDSQGHAFFANRSSGATTWRHPLEPSIRELAGVCRMCLTFPAPLRESTMATLMGTWESEAKQELAKWYSVKDENGREYYCHRDTMESMWEHPAEVVLPMHYLKIRSIERLRHEDALTNLRNQDAAPREQQGAHATTHRAAALAAATSKGVAPSSGAAPKRDAAGSTHERQFRPQPSPQAQPQPPPGQPSPASGARSLDASRQQPPEGRRPRPQLQALEAPQQLQALRSELAEARQQRQREASRSKDAAIKDAEGACVRELQMRDLEDVRRDLEVQLRDTTAAKAALQDELRHAESELQAAGTARQRTLQLEAELQEQRRTTEDQAMDFKELSASFNHALESAAEAQRGRLFLEVRLSAVYQDDATRDSILSSQDDVSRAFLEAAYAEEVHRREKLVGLDGSRLAAQGLLDQASARQEGLVSELEAADRELRESRAVALDFKEWARNAEVELEQERAQARRAQLACEELAADRGASERRSDGLRARLFHAEKELASIQSSDEGESASLRDQLAALSASTDAVQSEYQQAMQELGAARTAGDATRDRALQAEAQLLADRRNFDQALERVREAERGRATLEAKLAEVEKGMEERDSLARRVEDLQHELAEATSRNEEHAAEEASVDRATDDDRARQLEEQLRQAEAKLQDAQVLALGQGEPPGSRLEGLRAEAAERAERAEASLAAERRRVGLAEESLRRSEAELERAAEEREALQASLRAAGAASSGVAGLQAVLGREQERERGLSARAAAAELQLAEERRSLQRVEQRLERLERARAEEEERGARERESDSRQASKAEAQLAQERQGVAVLEVKLQASEAAAEAAEKARDELAAQLREGQQRQVALAHETGQLQAALESQAEASEQARERLAQLERLQSGSAEESLNAHRKLAEERVRLELAEHKLTESNTALAAASSDRAALQDSLTQAQERHALLSGRAAELEVLLSLEKRSVEAFEKKLESLEAMSADVEEDRSALAARLAEEESSRASVEQGLLEQRRTSRRLSEGKATEELTKMLADEQEGQDQLQRQIGFMEGQLEQQRASLEAAAARLREAEQAAVEASGSLAARSSAHATEMAALESQLGQERLSAEVIEQRLADEQAQREERLRIAQGGQERVAELRAELAEEHGRREGLSRQAAWETEQLVAGLRTELAEEHRHEEGLSQRLAQAQAELAHAREGASGPTLVQAQGGTAIDDAIEGRAPPPQQAFVPLEVEGPEFHRSSAPAKQDEQVEQVQVLHLKSKPAPSHEAEVQAFRTEIQEAREAEEKTRRLAAEAQRQHEDERQRFERAWNRLQQAKNVLEERQQAVERSLLESQVSTTASEDIVRSLKASLAEANQRQAQLSLEHDALAATLAAARAAQAEEESQREKLSLDMSELEASRSSAQAALDEQRRRAEQLSARCLELEALSAQARAEAAEAQQRSAEYEAMATQGQDTAALPIEKMALDLQALEASRSSAQVALDEERERARQLSSRCKELERLSSDAKAELAQAQARSTGHEAEVSAGQNAATAQRAAHIEKMASDLRALEASKTTVQVALDEERERARQHSSRCKELERLSSDAKAELAQAQARSTAHEATVAAGQSAAAAQAAGQIEKMSLDLQALEASKTMAQVALDQERSRAVQLSGRCRELEQLCSQGKADLARATADLAAAEARASQSAAQAVSPLVEVQESAFQHSSAPTPQEAQVDESPEAARRELLGQLEQAASAQERLSEGLERAEAEVAASRDRGSAADRRAAQAEVELAREKERVRTELERLQGAERAKCELEARLAAAEQGLAGGPADGVAEVDARIQSLRDELKAEQERGTRLLEAQQQLGGPPVSSESLRSELVQSRVELETLRAQGDSTLDRATRAEAELQQERQRATAEAKRATEAADVKLRLEGRLAQVEKDKMSNQSSLKVAEKKLKEQEQKLCHAQELERRVDSLEPKLEALEQSRARSNWTSGQEAVRGDARVAELEQRLAQATAWQAQLRDQLQAAEKKVNSTVAVSEDFRAFAAEAQEALAKERGKQEMTEQEAVQLSLGRDEALKAKSKLEAKLLGMDTKLKERHALLVEAPEKQAASRADDVAAGGSSKLQQAKPLEKGFKDERVHCSFKVEGIRYQQLVEDRNLKAAFEATVKQTLASEAGDLVPKANIRLVLTAGSVVVQASFEPTPGSDLGAVARRLRSSRAFPRKVAAYVNALDGIQRIASGTIKATSLSVTIDSELKERGDAEHVPAAIMSKSCSGDFDPPVGGKDCSRTQAQWEPLASKFFSRLDRLGTGCVENFQVLQLWPLLSRQVDSSSAAALAAQLLQNTSPMDGLEWMALMKALHNIVGPKRLRRNLRSAEAYYGELRAGGADAPSGVCSTAPTSPPAGASEACWPTA